MAIDASTPLSPAWWLVVLSAKLEQRNSGTNWSAQAVRRPDDARPGLLLLRSWYRGDPPLPIPAQGWRQGFREFLRMARMNYAELVIEPTRFRMRPAGWRTAVAGDDAGDATALQVSRANDLGVKFGDTAKDMLSLADGYMIVGKPDESTGFPLITSESPLSTITAQDSASGATLAALKLMTDEWTGDKLAFVYVPGELYVFQQNGSGLPTSNAAGWGVRDDLSGALPDFLSDVVPVVNFKNRDGVGDFETHLDVLERINNGILDRVVIGKLQAFRQRAIRGLPGTTDNQPPREDGANVANYDGAFEADPGALWQVPPGVDFWESQLADLNGVRSAIKDDVQMLAAATSTPLHLITPDAASGSAEGASLLREGHIFKVEDRRTRAQGSLARVMAMAFRFMGDTARADVSQIETLWEPAERFSLAEIGSAAAQSRGILPLEEIWTRIFQYAPDEVARLKSEMTSDMLFSALGGLGGAGAPLGGAGAQQSLPSSSSLASAVAADIGGAGRSAGGDDFDS